MKTYKVLFACLILLCVLSCKKDFLDKTPDEDLTIERAFSKRNLAESFLTSVYTHVPEEMDIAFHSWMPYEARLNPFIGGSDEMEFPWTSPFSQLMNSGAWGPSNNTQAPTPGFWDYNYQGIRKANLFLENVSKVPMNDSERNVWIGEATFLRAFYHFLVVRVYGPAVIMESSTPTAADFKSFRRQPFQNCVSFIVSECDKAIAALPMRVTADKYGRATRAAALALKARVLLYAASPLYNGNSAYAGFRDKENIALFPSFDQQLWKRAADAAKDCLDQSASAGYKLYRTATDDPMKNYEELFLVRNNDEVLFARNSGVHDRFERTNTPTGMGGWGGNAPTQEIVDDYQMANGLERNATGSGYLESGYTNVAHPKGYYPAGVSNMYVNREPRFYASILFNGQFWRERGVEFWNGSRDGRKSGPDFSPTGYLLRKFSDPTVNVVQGRFTLKTWIFFRLGEQYLNYAEALNEFDGPVGDVYFYVNEIRKRAGLANLPAGLTKDQMRDKIHLERRIELGFETHRFFDTRRWKTAEIIDNRAIHGLNIAVGTSLQDNAFYERKIVETRIFQANKHYLFPIPQTEINKNDNLVQNPGW